MIIAHNLHFLTECHSLKYIKVIPPDDSGNGYDMSPLYQMPHIKGLYLATEYGKKCELRTTVDYSRVNGLESVSVNPCGHTNYEKIETLKTLGISNIKNGDMRGLISSQQLDTIQAIQCDFISLNGIEIAKELKCLYLFYNRKLTDISALKCFSSSLTALRIENCPRITDFSTIGLLENLELLELSGSNSLPSVSFITQMPKLKTLILGMNVIDGDLTPCRRLSYVYCENHKRHYNMKPRDLPKGHFYRGNDTIDEWRRLE